MKARNLLRALHGRTASIALAVALFAIVFVVRYLFGTPGDGLGFLYLIPICLIASERGLRAGAVAGMAALLLFGIWDQLDSQHVSPLGYVTRALVFVGIGALCGSMATRVRQAAEEGDRYFELSSQMLGIFTMNGHPKRLNRRWTEVLGWTQQQFMGVDLRQLIHPDDWPLVEATIAQAATADGPAGVEPHSLRMTTADGGFRHLELASTVHPREGLIYASATDVTERHELEAARHQAEERFRVAFEDSATGMAVVALTGDHSGQIVEANQELGRVLGTPREELLGMSGLVNFAHRDDTERLRREMAELVSGDQKVVRCELRVVHPDGAVRWVHLTSSLLHGKDGEPLFRLSQLMDIDARRRADQQVQHMADHDPLSWLFNRRRFMDELTGELAGSRLRGTSGAVLMIDLDNFKRVNDLSGHAVGDEVIKTLSLALVRRLRSGDVAGRLGGDEFGVLLRRVTGEEAVLVSHDLLEAVSDSLALLDDEVARRVTLSIGIALVDGPKPTAGVLLERADEAMYEAKHDGGGRVALSAAALTADA